MCSLVSCTGWTKYPIRGCSPSFGFLSIAGGIPNISSFTGKRYTHNFNGCIVFVEGDAVGQVNLGKASVSGVNVDTCPV